MNEFIKGELFNEPLIFMHSAEVEVNYNDKHTYVCTLRAVLAPKMYLSLQKDQSI